MKHEADEVIRQLGEALNELSTVMNEAPNSSIGKEVAESKFQVYTQHRGRPSFRIKEEDLCFLLEEGFKVSAMSSRSLGT